MDYRRTYARKGSKLVRVGVDETATFLERSEIHIKQALLDRKRYLSLNQFAQATREKDAAEGLIVELNLMAEHFPDLRWKIERLVKGVMGEKGKG